MKPLTKEFPKATDDLENKLFNNKYIQVFGTNHFGVQFLAFCTFDQPYFRANDLCWGKISTLVKKLL